MLDQWRTPVDLLGCPTPAAWLAAADAQLPLLLVDHAHCEKKAASTALSLIYRYVDHPQLLDFMARLAREELRHFEQVQRELRKRNIAYHHLSPARYAAGLHQLIRKEEPARLVDTLLVGAFIEARSCERFAAVAPRLADRGIGAFFESLVASEQSHFARYLELAWAAAATLADAQGVAEAEFKQRVELICIREAELIQMPDPQFRFHSGVPAVAVT